MGGRRRARRPRRPRRRRGGRRRSPRATTSSASRSRRRVSEPADAWWAPVETDLELRGRLRARLPGQRAAAVVAARARARRDADGHVGHASRRRDRADDDATAAAATRDRVSRGRLVVHGHFYQPSRVDPFTGDGPAGPDRGAGPRLERRGSAPSATDPNAERGNLGRMSWDLGPTLAGWLERRRPGRLSRVRRRRSRRQRHGPAVPPHDPAARVGGRPADRDPLGPARLRSGGSAGRRRGIWLPETAVDLRDAAAARRRTASSHTILAPWQARRPTSTRAGRTGSTSATAASIVVALYDGGLSDVGLVRAAGDRRRRPVRRASGVVPRLASGVAARRRAAAGRDRHRRRAVRPPPAVPRPVPRAAGRARSTPTRAASTSSRSPRRWREPAGRPLPDDPDRRADVVELPPRRRRAGAASARARRTDAGRRPLRAALDRLAGGHRRGDRADRCRTLPGAPDPWAARDAYVDVVIGADEPAAFAARWLGGERSPGRVRSPDAVTFLSLMEAQRWRLAMFASDGWFWDDPDRPETAAVLRAAARAARLVDGLAGTATSKADSSRTWRSSAHPVTGSTAPRSTAMRWPRSASRCRRGYAERRGSIESIRLSTPKRTARRRTARAPRRR